MACRCPDGGNFCNGLVCGSRWFTATMMICVPIEEQGERVAVSIRTVVSHTRINRGGGTSGG